MSNPSKIFIHCWRVGCLGWAMALASAAFAGDGFHAGPIFDQFSLTLDSGHRIEAIGPFLYHQEADTEKTWAVPPLFSYDADPAVELKEFDFGYPVLTCERYGGEYRWQFCQLSVLPAAGVPKRMPLKRASRCIRSIFNNARWFRMKITPRSCRFTATSKTGCSAAKFSSSCSPSTAKPG